MWMTKHTVGFARQESQKKESSKRGNEGCEGNAGSGEKGNQKRQWTWVRYDKTDERLRG